MCDLIDLNSPDVKGLLTSAKLVSPLIPAPENVESNSETNLLIEKRESPASNPFDRVLHETSEYVSKKGDPFEVMLQRALKTKNRKVTELRAKVVDFTDDFTPRRTKRYGKTMNKTLDGLNRSLLEDKLSLFSETKELKKSNVSFDVRNTNVYDNNVTENTSITKQNCKIFVIGPDSLESSILNQSAMNDTLLKTVPKCKEDDNISPFLEKDILFKELIPPLNTNLKPPDLRRSLSQGAGKSPTKLLYLNKRSQSVTDGQRKALQSDSSTTLSFLDRGFLESKQSQQSVFSTLSNVSSIAKLTSVSLSSSVLLNDTMNHAFLHSDPLKTSHEKINITENSTEIKLQQCDLSDLAERLNKLKYAMDGISSLSITEDKSNSMKKEDKRITNDKLIDVDIFLPEQNSNKECDKSSISTSSSDSVFIDASKERINKLILNEAKTLARTFEELSQRTDSGSSMDDDLISNNTLWMSELLPAFEDEPIVNLIELPISPEKNSDDKNNNKKQISTNVDNADKNSQKEIESQFTVPAVKPTIVTSLLSDLKNLIKTENNPEVNKLLDNLENALDVNCKNNTELLIKCLNISNELQSPRKVSTDIIETSGKASTGKSETELSEKKLDGSEKLLSDINHKLENISQTATVSYNNSLVKFSSCKDNNKNHFNIINSCKEAINTDYAKKDNQLDEKLAIELLVNLEKLLSGQAKDATIMQLLKNIGKVLNVASKNCEIKNEMQMDCGSMYDFQQNTSIKASESGRNAHSTAFLKKEVHRRSFESKSKSSEKIIRRSIRRSISATDPLSKNTSGMQIYKRKDTSELKDRKKRAPNDPGFINNLANKKIATPEICNVRKEKITGSDTKKEKSIAISDVKNKLKKRSDVVNKRGPMKAMHPVDNMRKKGASLGKQMTPPQATTPPKSDKMTSSVSKIISSTPNSMDNNYYMPKKSVKSKPIASSTPDDQNNKASCVTPINKKRNLSCDISPVTTHINMSGSDEQKDSSKRLSKLPTSKRCITPKLQQTDMFGVLRYCTPPKYNSSLNKNYQQPTSQCLNKSLIDCQRYSPVCQKESMRKIQESPLKENNRNTPKVKPYKLISKLKRHSISDFTEKENNYN